MKRKSDLLLYILPYYHTIYTPLYERKKVLYDNIAINMFCRQPYIQLSFSFVTESSSQSQTHWNIMSLYLPFCFCFFIRKYYIVRKKIKKDFEDKDIDNDDNCKSIIITMTFPKPLKVLSWRSQLPKTKK